MNELDLILIIHTSVAQVSIWQIYSFHCDNVNTLFCCLWRLFCQIFVHNVQMCFVIHCSKLFHIKFKLIKLREHNSLLRLDVFPMPMTLKCSKHLLISFKFMFQYPLRQNAVFTCDDFMSGGATNLGHLCPEVMKKWMGHVEQRQGDWERGSHHVSFMQVSVGNKKTNKNRKYEGPSNYKELRTGLVNVLQLLGKQTVGNLK